MDPRIRTIRFWLLAVLGMVFMSTFHEWSTTYVLPMLMMPPSLLTPSLPANCTNICTTAPTSQYQVVTSGFSDSGDCTTCASYNGTWTLTDTTCAGWAEDTDCQCASFEITPCICRTKAFAVLDDSGIRAVREITLVLRNGLTRIDVFFGANNNGTAATACQPRDTSLAINPIVYWNNSGSAIDCGGLSSYSVAYSVDILGGCAFDNSAAIVTSL